MNTIQIIAMPPVRISRKSGVTRHIPYTVSPLDKWRTNPAPHLRGHAKDTKKDVLRNNK